MNNNSEVYFLSTFKCEETNKSQYDEMVREGWIFSSGDGRIIYNEKFYNIMKKIDSYILSWALKDNAAEIHYSDFYHLDDLVDCNYITQFHPHCFFVCKSQTDKFDQFKLGIADFVNNPAVCMHSYIQYRNSVIDEKEPIIITSKSKCKRNEHEYSTLERMLDFTMREIIFMGTESYVLKKRVEYMDRAKQLMFQLNLDGNICLSHDPFFKKEDKEKVNFQKKFKLKYEMNLRIPFNNHLLAVGSFNYHNINFSRAYNIRNTKSQYIHTACVAFGLERFAYACVEQMGLNCADILPMSVEKGS